MDNTVLNKLKALRIGLFVTLIITVFNGVVINLVTNLIIVIAINSILTAIIGTFALYWLINVDLMVLVLEEDLKH